MKKFYVAVIIAAALTMASTTKTLAQDEPVAPAPPSPPVPAVIIHDAQHLAEDTVHKLQNDIEKQTGQLQQQMQQEVKSLKNHVRYIGRRVTGGKSLVVRSSDMTPPEQKNLEEDLAVMTHILDKALSDRFADDQSARVAMGINVTFVPGEHPMRSLYLDGYGALFFVNVNFPLLAPPAAKNVEKEKPPTDSTWEEARQELYGQPAGRTSESRSHPEYDATKVKELKDALLDSMKDASNIRGIQPDESITVCVIGAPVGAPKHTATGSGGGGSQSADSDYAQAIMEFDRTMGSFPGARDDAGENKTTLTIRVRKADCEAFAKGKLTADEFRNKAVIRIYGDPAVAP